MKDKHLDKKILLFVYNNLSPSTEVLEMSKVAKEFGGYSRGYVYDRVLILTRDGYLSRFGLIREFVSLTRKGAEAVEKLKEEEQRTQKE